MAAAALGTVSRLVADRRQEQRGKRCNRVARTEWDSIRMLVGRLAHLAAHHEGNLGERESQDG